MNACLLSIGDELLIGQVVNTNASWIAEQLSLSGIPVSRIVAVADRQDDITQALLQASATSQLIIMTGGLGPTRDDITKKALASFFGVELVRNDQAVSDIEAFLRARGRTSIESNVQQADLPSNALFIRNPIGTAPGMWIEHQGSVYVSLPGVPHEMKHLMQTEVLPRLATKYSTGRLAHKTLHTCGIPESELAHLLAPVEDTMPEGLTLAYLPSPGYIRLRLTARDIQNSSDVLTQAEAAIRAVAGEYIWGQDTDTLESKVIATLTQRGASLSCAESCTGGLLAHLLTSVSGASACFAGSVTAYSNQIKEQVLGVPRSLLAAHGAVSRPVVEAMACGVARLMGTDYAIASSGVAGPSGGTAEKPTGTVWLAVSKGQQVDSKLFQLGNGQRLYNIQKATATALWLLIKKLENS